MLTSPYIETFTQIHVRLIINRLMCVRTTDIHLSDGFCYVFGVVIERPLHHSNLGTIQINIRRLSLPKKLHKVQNKVHPTQMCAHPQKINNCESSTHNKSTKWHTKRCGRMRSAYAQSSMRTNTQITGKKQKQKKKTKNSNLLWRQFQFCTYILWFMFDVYFCRHRSHCRSFIVRIAVVVVVGLCAA